MTTRRPWKQASAVILLCAATAIAVKAQSFIPAFNFDESNVPVIKNSVNVASWAPFAELAASQNNNASSFGVSVSVSGRVAVVGSDGDSVYTGAAYVFAQPSGGSKSVTQTAKLIASDGQPGDRFGDSVSISEKTIVVGAPGANNGQGKAYIFVEPPTGWADATETAQLAASDGQESDSFGTSVSIDGQTGIIGAPYHTVGSNTFQGTAYVFVQAVGGWMNMTQTGELTASNGTAEAYLGFSVAISGNTAVAGAYGAAAACVFVEPAGGWANMTQTAELGDSKQSVKSELGYSVAIRGSTIVTGAPNGTTAKGRTGIAQVYLRPGSTWRSSGRPTATLSASINNVGDQFGYSVATTGGTVLAGAPYAPCYGINCRQGIGPGGVYAFAEPTGGWVDSTETEGLGAADGKPRGGFGVSVAASGNEVLIGATGTNTAYVFQYSSNSTFTGFGFPGTANTFGEGINDLGQIVGNYESDDASGAFLYENGTFTTISDPNASGTSAYKINNAGEIVGVISVDNVAQGFVELNNVFTTISYPGAGSTYGMGLNDAGDVVGDYEDASGNSHGFLYSGGVFTSIDGPGALNTNLADINDSEQIVGTYCIAPCGVNSATVSFIYENGTFTPIKYPRSEVTGVYGINNNADLTGTWQAADTSGNFIYFNSTKQFVPFYLTSSAAFGLNDSDEVVGTFADEEGRYGFYGHLPGH